jgi:hypothetical protein
MIIYKKIHRYSRIPMHVFVCVCLFVGASVCVMGTFCMRGTGMLVYLGTAAACATAR